MHGVEIKVAGEWRKARDYKVRPRIGDLRVFLTPYVQAVRIGKLTISNDKHNACWREAGERYSL